MQRTLLTLSLLLFCLGFAAAGQNVGATVTGFVKDASGAVVPGAKIVVTNVGTNVERTGTSNGSGLYSISEVPAGVFTR